MFSILHISDLHRSRRYPITNDELISALMRDRERYVHEDPPVRAPDAIVVSGDLIQGVPLRTSDCATKLGEQYAVAEDFLNQLVQRFVNGDRSRIIIVPGNHDVDWNTARQAMALVCVEDAPTDIPEELLRESSSYRWNWRTRELYQIVDEQLYAKRLDAFWDFFNRFYAKVPGLLRVQRGADANLFSLCGDHIAVVAFNSCHGNDCFAFHGMIKPDAIARSYLDLTASGPTFDLHVAVWHHSLEGPPYRTDYMDIELVRAMVGRGFRLGLHGHQHKAQAAPQKVFLPEQETMAVVSAGSLCAGPNDLPPGVHRQYNVVEISDNFQSATVHVREMTVGSLFGRAALAAFAGRSFVTLDWEPPTDLAGRPIDASAERLRATIEDAERLFKSHDPARCVRILAPQKAALPSYGRQLLIDAASQAQEWELVRDITNPPRTIEELMRLVDACLHFRDFASARDALDRFARTVNLSQATLDELRTRIGAEETIHR